MDCVILFIFVSLIASNFAKLSLCQEEDKYTRMFCGSNKGNFTNSSTYSSDRKNLLSQFSSLKPNDYGFYNFSAGQNSDEKVNGIALCKGDIKEEACVECIKGAAKKLPELCPNNKEAIIYYESCMLRFSNRSIFGVDEYEPKFYLWSPINMTDRDKFNQVLRVLLDTLRTRAAAGDSHRKYATGNTTGPAFQTIYALTQCTPDLSQQQCDDCLIWNFAEFPRCCDWMRGGRTVGPSCNFRYEIYRFFDPSADPGLPVSISPGLPESPPTLNSDETTNAKGEEYNKSRTAIIVVVPFLGLIAIIICLYVFLKMRKRKTKETVYSTPKDKVEDAMINMESFLFDFDTIQLATNNFSDENKLGQGGFGAVYRGKLPDGQEIAVKRLAKNSNQGDNEFQNEALLLAKLQHRNLVRLLGFCIKNNERLLVYEFVLNASLDNFIFDPIKRVQLNWENRYKIIGGVARGLLYLHEDSRLRVIHRDMKASNILLDADMTPKIADFGLAKLVEFDQTQAATSRIAGTFGYMAPEYVMYGHFSVKTDVFSFGVLALEIVTGQKNNCFRTEENVEDLLGSVWRCWKDGTVMDMVDPSLNFNSSMEIIRCIHIGLLCVEDNVADRPTMGAVAVMLSSNSLTLRAPMRPAYVVGTTIIPSEVSSSMDFSSTTSSGPRSELLPLSKNVVV